MGLTKLNFNVIIVVSTSIGGSAMKNRRTKRRRLPLQKIDEATNNLIDEYQAFLFSMGVRISRERGLGEC